MQESNHFATHHLLHSLPEQSLVSVSFLLWSSAVFLQMSFLTTVLALYFSKSRVGSSLSILATVEWALSSLLLSPSALYDQRIT